MDRSHSAFQGLGSQKLKRKFLGSGKPICPTLARLAQMLSLPGCPHLSHFILLFFKMAICIILRERNVVDLGDRGGEEDLGGVMGGEP